jgi:hypothetical protein
MQRFSDGFEDSKHARWIDAHRDTAPGGKKEARQGQDRGS